MRNTRSIGCLIIAVFLGWPPSLFGFDLEGVDCLALSPHPGMVWITIPSGGSSTNVVVAASDDSLLESLESVELRVLPPPIEIVAPPPPAYWPGTPSEATAFIYDHGGFPDPALTEALDAPELLRRNEGDYPHIPWGTQTGVTHDGIDAAGTSAYDATLTLSNIQLTQADSYTLAVSNPAGSGTSFPATLSVLPAPSGPGSLDITFDPTHGGEKVGLGDDVWAFVSDLVVQPDGQIVVVGMFAGVNGYWRNGLARLSPEGRLDPSFNPEWVPRGFLTSVVLQPDGRIIIAGSMSDAASTALLVRLHANGQPDLTLSPPVVTNGEVKRVLLQPDGKLFVTYHTGVRDGYYQDRLVRLLPDGTPDLDFQEFRTVHIAVQALQPNGKILMSLSGPTGAQGMVRLDVNGSVDPTFNGPAITRGPWGATGNLYALEIQSDGNILIGGDFDRVGTVPRHNLARLLPDGQLHLSFDPEAPNEKQVETIALQPDGKILATGWFPWDAGEHRGLVRLNADGSLDRTFDYAADPMAEELLAGPIWVGNDGRLLIAGDWLADGARPRKLFRLQLDGAWDNTFDPSFQGVRPEVYCLAPQADGGVVVGGRFGWFDDTRRVGCLRLNEDGSLDAAFHPVLSLPPGIPATETAVQATLAQPDGTILVGGNFQAIDGLSRRGVARLHADGSVDAGFDPSTGFEPPRGPEPRTPSRRQDPGGRLVLGSERGAPRTDRAAQSRRQSRHEL